MKYYKKPAQAMDYTSGEFTRCWTCKKACGGCSWSREFKPVAGWTAQETYIISNGEYAASYQITACPEYERG